MAGPLPHPFATAAVAAVGAGVLACGLPRRDPDGILMRFYRYWSPRMTVAVIAGVFLVHAALAVAVTALMAEVVGWVPTGAHRGWWFLLDAVIYLAASEAALRADFSGLHLDLALEPFSLGHRVEARLYGALQRAARKRVTHFSDTLSDAALCKLAVSETEQRYRNKGHEGVEPIKQTKLNAAICRDDLEGVKAIDPDEGAYLAGLGPEAHDDARTAATANLRVALSGAIFVDHSRVDAQYATWRALFAAHGVTPPPSWWRQLRAG